MNTPEQPRSRTQDDSPLGPSRRTVLAAERTWLAWFRTGIGVATAAVGVGGVVPRIVDGTVWGYIVLGCCFAALAVAVFVEGFRRQREIYRALDSDEMLPTGVSSIAVLSVAGGLLAVATLVLLLLEL